jgi:geranylgeranylglycerol-phosphate geranylgeranyltransferase
MNSKKVKAVIQIGRPINVLITLASIPVACWIAGGTFVHWTSMLIAAATGALVTIGANAINDVFDIEIDRVNRPERPLPAGTLTTQDARTIWFTSSIVSIGLNLFLTIPAFLIVIGSVVLLYYYSERLKRTVFIGNLVVGMMTGMAFFYGGVVVGSIERAIMPALFAFLVNLARELVKDVEDIEGDRMQKAITLPIRFGVLPALILASGSIILLLGFTVIAIFLKIYTMAFAIMVSVADVILIGTVILVWSGRTPAHMRRISNLLKISMVVGLISIIVGSL